MAGEAYAVSNPSSSTTTEYVNSKSEERLIRLFRDAMVRKKKMWIIFGTIAGILIITVIVVPTSVVLTKKNKTTTTAKTTTAMTMKTTDIISSTKKGL